MAETIKSLKNSIKRAAGLESGRIKLQSSKKSFAIPVEARIIETEGYVYLTLPMSTGIYRKDEQKGLVQLADTMSAPGDLVAQMTAATEKGPKGAKKGAGPGIPEELVKKLADSIPSGYKLGLKNGELTLVKARAPRKDK